MCTATEHYANHLGPVYTWMVGDLQAAQLRAEKELDALGIPKLAQGLAIDLGAGFGLHAIPLASRGYTVTAIDNCQILLEQLRVRGKGLPVTAVAGDILDFSSRLSAAPNVILCMGDTLTQLADRRDVERLFGEISTTIADDGLFASTFRDYISAPLQGDRRFIPVRSDADRILTCFLEYSEHSVRVHDLIHEREKGQWRQRISSYSKLRLDPEWVVSALRARGLDAHIGAGAGGMVSVVARKR